MPRLFGAVLLVLLLSASLLLGGCSGNGGGKLAIRSKSPQGGQLQGGFSQGLYRYDDRNNVTVLLFEGTPENPTQAVTIRLFWAPRAGRTPVDETATNAVMHYVILAGQESKEAGIYSGAGFVYPTGKIGGKNFSAEVWHASLRLTDSSANFQDRLGQALLIGNFSARRDDAAFDQVLRKLHINLRERLGYPRLVELPAQRVTADAR